MNLQTIPIDKISQGDNVRKDMTKDSLNTLIESIKDKGILQPILVSEKSGKFQIIAGHRRYNSAVHAGLKEIPALVTKIEEDKRVEYQITENLQRADLNAIDEALAYKELLEKFKVEDIVVITGKSLYRIKRVLSLLNLSKELQEMVKKKELSEKHALVISKLKAAKAQNSLAAEIKRTKMSPEQAEKHLEDYSQKLDNALFDKKECKECSFNGNKVNDLFDDKTVKGQCLNSSCFVTKVKQYKSEQKKKILEKFKNKKDHCVIVLDNEPKYGSKEYEQLKDLIDFKSWRADDFDKTIFKNECAATCPTFIHVINARGEAGAYCANPACFDRNIKRSKALAKKTGDIKSGKKGEGIDEAKEEAKRKAAFEAKRKESRVDSFQRDFYLSKLKEKISDVQIVRVAVDKLLSAENGSKTSISDYLGLKKKSNYEIRYCLPVLTKMKKEDLLKILKKIALGRLPEYETGELSDFGKEAGILIGKEFIITKEYLEKFSKQGLVKLASELKLKTELNFGKQGKSDMIAIMLKIGVKGKIPKEMLK